VLNPMRNLPNYGDVPDAVARAEAVAAARGSDNFLAVGVAFKRMKNILDQAHDKHEAVPTAVDTNLLSELSEKVLDTQSKKIATAVASLSAAGHYVNALREIATLRTTIDDFFATVMVMDHDPAVRANRLALLSRISQDFSRIADFSEIVTAG
jgi:glycyl-tRNA synthetase beta chain